MNTDTTLEKAGTDQLRHGDVLVHHLMRLVIDRPIDTIALPAGPALRTSARITNWDELIAAARADDADGIANSAARFIICRADEDDDGEHRWTIQGDALSTWWRQPADDPAAN